MEMKASRLQSERNHPPHDGTNKSCPPERLLPAIMTHDFYGYRETPPKRQSNKNTNAYGAAK
jgi:hypothetical protein